MGTDRIEASVLKKFFKMEVVHVDNVDDTVHGPRLKKKDEGVHNTPWILYPLSIMPLMFLC